MKNTVPVQFKFDEKMIKRVLALIGADIPSSEEIQKRFFNREPIEFDVSEVESDEAEFALCVMVVSVILKIEG
jgi:hypothetical protein